MSEFSVGVSAGEGGLGGGYSQEHHVKVSHRSDQSKWRYAQSVSINKAAEAQKIENKDGIVN